MELTIERNDVVISPPKASKLTSTYYTEDNATKTTLEYFNGDELATNVFMTKYALRDKQNNILELTPDDMHKRLAKEFARIEKKFECERQLSYDTIYSLLKHFKYIVPQGSPMMGIGNDYTVISLSNCVVASSPQDNISSIVDTGKTLANLFKRRCGVGIDISELRPENANVNNAAVTSTGAWSFADFFSYVCRMIAQSGRRGALMLSMDVRHPDIEKFVTMKHDKSKVTGANVSVKITDDFMLAVENNSDFILRFPVSSTPEKAKYTKVIKARDLWNMIISSATNTAEPGLLMWDNICKYLPAECYADDGFKTISTNPCGELPLSVNDSCRLMSINLKNFVKNRFQKDASFDFVLFKSVVSSAMRLSDDLVELEIEKLTKIIEITDTHDEKMLWGNLLNACKKGRRTGLGTHGLADAIACMNMKYDDNLAQKFIGEIYQTLRDEAYNESVCLAKERGAFSVFDWDKEKDNLFINQLPAETITNIKQHGRRNISILTNAPTGSVSIMSQTSSGIEPVFRNSYIRRRKLSHNEQNITPDFIDSIGDKWSEYRVFHHNVQSYLDDKHTDIIPELFIESDKIDWKKRIIIQAIIQKNIDHSVSSTINLPAGTPISTVGELYFEGWKNGLKGITVYVDGSRSGVLITDNEKDKEFQQNDAPKRPDELECDIHQYKIKNENYIALVGLLQGKPYEVFCGKESEHIEIQKMITKGRIIKRRITDNVNRYDLACGSNGDSIVIKNITKVFQNPNFGTFSRMLSLSLRHGASVQYIVEQLTKDDNEALDSFTKVMSRVLKTYINNGTVITKNTCNECKNNTLVYQDGCITCTSCGWGKC